MILRRFFTEPENINENTAVILEDAAHIKKVLRMNPGDEILIFDGSGREYTARLSEIGSDRWSCRNNIGRDVKARADRQGHRFSGGSEIGEDGGNNPKSG